MPDNTPPQADTGLEYLSGLDGEIQVQNQDGYFIKFEVHQVKATPDRPHGIKYSLSLHDMARVMSGENLAMLKIIREQQPASVSALAKTAGKHAPKVSPSLVALEQFGLVRLVQKGRTKKTEVTADDVLVSFA
ncbi:hypothetical protein ACL9RI_18515 [Janthinobacterium sp. Mn2066]